MHTYHVYQISADGYDFIIAAPSSLEAARKIAKQARDSGVKCYVL